MYKKILIPLDGSKLAEHILPYARFLARALGIPVELLRVNDPARLAAYSPPLQGSEYLEAVARSFPDINSVTREVALGKAAEVIADWDAGQAQTLIAMATHGRSGAQRWLLGSVADKVLHGSRNHLLLVRPGQGAISEGEAALKTVVVALDGSDLAETVLPYVTELARKAKLELILVRVYSVLPPAYDAEGYVPDVERLAQEIRAEAQSYLERKSKELRDEGADRVSQVLLKGDAGGEIIAYAKRTPGNLVAMCTHGRSGIGRWVLGSVTERVVRHSGEPVLVIRAAPES